MKLIKKIFNTETPIIILLIAVVSIIVGYSMKMNNIKIQRKIENDHFIFYSTDVDEKCLNDLEKNLEESYNRISKDLDVALNYKVNVNIYPTIEAFHKAVDIDDAEDWLVGMAKGKEIYMVSPLNPGNVHDYDSLMKVIVHEFTHVLVNEINSETDNYLNEGIAVVEAKQINDGFKYYLKSAADNGSLPTIDDMSKNYFQLESPYVVSGGFMEFLINTYGYETVRKIIAIPNNIESVTNKAKKELNELWIEYVSENY